MTTPGSLAHDIDEWEPAVDDLRLAKVNEAVLMRYPALSGATFVTFVQPAKLLTEYEPPRELREMAVFAILSPNPRAKGQNVMTHGTAALEDFESADREARHFVGVPDPLLGIYLSVARKHIETMQNLREMN